MARREFTASVKAEIIKRANGICENRFMPKDILHRFVQPCPNPPTDVDHIYADTLETDKSGPLTADDGAYLCKMCHLIKTGSDQKMRAKRNKHAVRKDRPKPGWFQSGQKLQSGGFNKTYRKKMNGSVEKRK